MPKHQRIVGLHFGDWHCGQRYGLIRPGTNLVYGVGSEAEEKTYDDRNISDWSKWLWYDVYLPGIDAFQDFAAGDLAFCAHSGDITHGDRHLQDDEFYSIRKNHQVQIAVEAHRPLREIKSLFLYLICFGTGAHDYSQNSATESVATDLAAWGWHVNCDEHLTQIFPGGLRFNLAHHGPSVSAIKRNRENAGRNYLKDRIQDALDWQYPYANLYQRGHVHMPVYTPAALKSGPDSHTSDIIVTPPLCGPNRFARKVTRSMEYVESGMYFSETIDGRLNRVVPFIRKKMTSAVYKLKNEGVKFFCYDGKAQKGIKKKRKKRKK